MATQATTHTEAQTEQEELQEMEDASKKGWDNFTKFLLSNVVLTIIGLLFLGALTVWR